MVCLLALCTVQAVKVCLQLRFSEHLHDDGLLVISRSEFALLDLGIDDGIKGLHTTLCPDLQPAGLRLHPGNELRCFKHPECCVHCKTDAQATWQHIRNESSCAEGTHDCAVSIQQEY